ncbi:MAG: hypothetical protein K2H64_04035 [Desulfovibrio sp.]|nr:hypothetical protein [Desulfovibrio sp.]
MLSLAKNDRGIRLASAALLLLPVAWLIFVHSRSRLADVIIFTVYFVIALAGILGLICENAELAEETTGGGA